jgi:hypothetical protein
MAIIDPIAYRRIETSYKVSMPTSIRQAFSLEVFEKCGFPTLVDSIVDLRPFLNTMQDGRFRKYYEELNGLSEFDSQLFIFAVKKHFQVQQKYFPNKNPILPFDILISGLLVAKKLKYFVPNAKKILEIGPGVCQTSFFLKDYLPNLENISYVEACQSFYILQSITLDHIFGERFLEHGHELSGEEIQWYTPNHFKDPSYGTIRCNDNSSDFIVSHYPYFKFPDIKKEGNKYDLIMANACLNEISLSALDVYLSEIKRELISVGGYLFYQCPGGHHDGRDIVKILNQHGFNPLFVSSINANFNIGANAYLSWRTPTPTGLFKFTGHPLDLSALDTMALSIGHKAYCTEEILPALISIHEDSTKNFPYEFFEKNFKNDLNI